MIFSVLRRRNRVVLIKSPLGQVHEDAAQSGFALVAVLGLVLIISAVLLPFSTSARLRALTAENALRSFRYDGVGEILTRHVAENISTLADRVPMDAVRAGAAP